MKTGLLGIIAGTSVLFPCAYGGSYKRISIDGSFDDWIGVPVAIADEADADGKFDFKDVSIANDADFLYVRLRLHSPANYASFQHQVIIDGDGNSQTGLSWVGLGSELMIENGAGYQQKNGQFNEGGASQLSWSAAPVGSVTQVEVRISRATLDAEAGDVFTNPDIVLSFVARNLDWQITDTVEAVPYTFTDTPNLFHGTTTVIGYQSVSWAYQETKDPETDWPLPEFSTDPSWKNGVGFTGFGLAGGVYPAVATTLVAGRTTYYFRTSFQWQHDTLGVAVLADVYLSDGAVIHLNGAEVRRVRMPAGQVAGSTQATGPPAAPGAMETFSLPVSALAVGANLLAVEVHQEPGSPNALAFGFSLRASDSIPPSFESPAQPSDRTVVEGQGTVFTPGTIAGTEPFRFQWFRDNQPVANATGATLAISPVLVDDAGGYFVEVSNDSGMVRSRTATLATTAEPVALANPAEPADRGVIEGERTTFTAAVTGSPLLAYQWHKDGTPIQGANAPAYTIDSAGLENAGEYHVTVSNRVNSVSSRKARLTVASDTTAPAIAEISGSSGRIVIRFSEPVDEATATDPARYTLPGIAITGGVVSADRRTVTLTTGPFPFAQTVQFRVNGVEDRFNNALSASAPFRSTISIDGLFDDWEGISPAASDPDETGQGGEFKEYWVANDGEFLYVRFSFHRQIGQLPVDFYYQLFFDTDNDPATGFPVSGIGSSMMIENGGGWLQRGGGFNEGGLGNTQFLLAPEAPSSQFECRVSLDSAVNADQSPVFTGDTIGVTLNLVSTSWVVVDHGPVGQPIAHTLITWPSLTPPTAFAITSITDNPAAGSLTVSWNSTAGGSYSIETSGDLHTWVEVLAGIPSAGQATITRTVQAPANAKVLFLRIRK